MMGFVKLLYRPFGACSASTLQPTAYAPSTGSGQAVGCILAPLRGCSAPMFAENIIRLTRLGGDQRSVLFGQWDHVA